MPIDFYRLETLAGKPSGLPQAIDETGMYLERFNRLTEAWVEETPALAKYLWNGEIGATPITAAEAEVFIASLIAPYRG